MQSWNPDDAIGALMDRFARPAIHIHRPYPPPSSYGGRSKLGGLPNLPPNVEWPYGRSHHRSSPRRTPLHFLAQIDCRELPRNRNGLPGSGMLYFFANMYDMAAWDGHPPEDYRRVIYAPHVAPDRAVMPPPADIPIIGDAYPRGYSDAHAPDDPLNRKIYFEWPIQFATSGTYPATDAIRATREWATLEAEWQARSETDTAFRDEYGDKSGMADFYQEKSRERIQRAMRKALGLPESEAVAEPGVTQQRWRQIAGLMRGAFPPVAAFVSEIAAQIDAFLVDEIVRWDERRENGKRAAEAADEKMGFFQRLLGARAPARPLTPMPDWLEDLRIVRSEAAQWLRQMRALPANRDLKPAERERLLAWLDDLDQRGWARIDGHRPTLQSVGYPFDQAMFQLARHGASRPAIRAHFSDELYRSYPRMAFPNSPRHQMLGWFPSSQQPKPIDDPMVPLLMLSYDDCPDFRFGDAGEMQFFIKEADLKAKNFDRVETQMQGG